MKAKNLFALFSIVMLQSFSARASLLGGILGGDDGSETQISLKIPFVDNSSGSLLPINNGLIPNVSLGQPNYSGDGCPQDSVAFSLSPDSRGLSIVFNNFSAEAGNEAHTQSAKQTCHLIIPVNAQPGYRMAVAQLDYRGFRALPAGAAGKLWAIHQIRHAGLNILGPKVTSTQNFQGPGSDEFLMSAVIENSSLVDNLQLPILSPITDPILNPILHTCGGTYNLEVDTGVSVTSNAHGEETLLNLNSVDAKLKSGVNFDLVWEKCEN